MHELYCTIYEGQWYTLWKFDCLSDHVHDCGHHPSNTIKYLMKRSFSIHECWCGDNTKIIIDTRLLERGVKVQTAHRQLLWKHLYMKMTLVEGVNSCEDTVTSFSTCFPPMAAMAAAAGSLSLPTVSSTPGKTYRGGERGLH